MRVMPYSRVQVVSNRQFASALRYFVASNKKRSSYARAFCFYDGDSITLYLFH